MTDEYDYKAEAHRLGEELEKLRNHLALTELSPKEVSKRLDILVDAAEDDDGPIVEGWIADELNGIRKRILDAMCEYASPRLREFVEILRFIDNLQGVDP